VASIRRQLAPEEVGARLRARFGQDITDVAESGGNDHVHRHPLEFQADLRTRGVLPTARRSGWTLSSWRRR
jgi:hypothetical protein